MNLQLKVLSTESQIAPYLADWTELAPTPMQSPQWMLGWWSAFKNDSCHLQIIVFLDKGRTVGLAPLYYQDSWSQGSSIRFLGSGKACTDYQTILSIAEYQEAVTEALCDWLTDACNRGTWGSCDWDGISSTDVVIRRVCETLADCDMLVHPLELESTWRLDLTGGWPAVLALMCKTQRRQSRNLINRFDKQGCYTSTVADTPHSVPAALDTLMNLHQLRWQAVGKPGCFSDERFVEFMRSSCVSLAAAGQCQIRSLHLDGRCVASQLLLHDAGGYYMYQTGRDPAQDANAVGRILTLATIRSLCESGADFLDYLRGDELYKPRLGAQATPLRRVQVVAPLTRHRVQHASSLLGRTVKQTFMRLASASGLRRSDTL